VEGGSYRRRPGRIRLVVCAAAPGLESTWFHPQLEDAMTRLLSAPETIGGAAATYTHGLADHPAQGQRDDRRHDPPASAAKTGANGCLHMELLAGLGRPGSAGTCPCSAAASPCSWSVCLLRSPVNWPRAGPQPRDAFEALLQLPPHASVAASGAGAGRCGTLPAMPCGAREQLHLSGRVRWGRTGGTRKPCKRGKPAGCKHASGARGPCKRVPAISMPVSGICLHTAAAW